MEELDRPALKPLPIEPYVFAEWRLRRVGIDYHVDIDSHFYSVPHRFARAEVEARLTARTVEIFARGERIAVHLRASGNHQHTTIPDHMPSSHRRYSDWTMIAFAAVMVLGVPFLTRRAAMTEAQRAELDEAMDYSAVGQARFREPFPRSTRPAPRNLAAGIRQAAVRRTLAKRPRPTGVTPRLNPHGDRYLALVSIGGSRLLGDRLIVSAPHRGRRRPFLSCGDVPIEGREGRQTTPIRGRIH